MLHNTFKPYVEEAIGNGLLPEGGVPVQDQIGRAADAFS